VGIGIDIIDVGGIPTAEVFGLPTIEAIPITPQEIYGVGNISSGETFGITDIGVTVTPIGIDSQEAFGYPALATLFRIDGITKNSKGQPVGGCLVKLFETATDTRVQQKTSAEDGTFSFVVPDTTTTYFIISFSVDVFPVSGITANTLVGV
jgi:hypothetical protein